MNRSKLYSAVTASILALGATASQAQTCTLELAPGATMVGSSSEDFLVIEQGCRIDAQGTADQPIDFTAEQAVMGTVGANERGLWGGVVLNGRAPINDCPAGATGGTDACTKEGEANSGLFGGSDPNDDSGILTYVRVSYAGSNVDPENQLNGIAFQGVGSGTVVDYVQVHNNLDDGMEFFGGNVNIKHVVLTGNADDSLDWTDGWQGSVQYLYLEQTDTGDNLIEADNREGDENVLPRSIPSISNMSGFGLAGENGLRLRRGTGIHLTNSIVQDSGTCVQVEGASRDLLGSDLTIEGTSFDCAEMHKGDDDGAVKMYLDSAPEVSQSGGSVNPVTPVGGFFEAADFVGAIGPDNWTAGWTLPGTVSHSTANPGMGCPAGTTEAASELNGMTVCDLTGTLTSNLTLSSGRIYRLNGKVVVGGDNTDSAVLTVQAGVTVIGGTSTDFLVVSRGSQLMVNGTRNAPVTFTSQSDLEGNVDPVNSRGEWGGIVLNGNAPINDCPAGAAGGTDACTKEGEANSGIFGGSDPADSSGSLKYLVVKYAGSNVDPENQLNGIGFQGVGSGTTVDYVQVHNNLDDGMEFFGGNVHISHIVLTGNADDSLDWTDGWRGGAQYVLVNQASDAGDNGIEADNREGGENNTPRSMPLISNMSIIGNPAERGVLFRRGTGVGFYNSLVTGSATCIKVDGDVSTGLLGTDLNIGGVIFDCPTAIDGDEPELLAYLNGQGNVSLDGSAVPSMDVTGMGALQPVDYVGAFGDGETDSDNWASGWTFGTLNTGLADAPVAGCPAGTTEGAMIAGKPSCILSGTYTTDLTLNTSNYFVLDGKVVIGGDNTNSAILTLPAGTTIVGDNDTDFLVISRGSQIVANGSDSAPVTLTAIQDVEGQSGLENARGLWGGLVLNGNAPINDCPAGADGGTDACTKEGEANSGIFGGSNPDDSSGKLHYVVVKYAGSNVDPENQLNGIAFQGVGAGTQFDHVQVHNNLDDGFEFFGGTVSGKYIVLSGNADDSLDWTDGWQGRLQYVHIVQASDAGDHGIEADNREGGENNMPRSMPQIANMTIVGNTDSAGILLRRGTGANIWNSVVTDIASCIKVDGDVSLGLLGDLINIESTSFDCPTIVEDGNATTQSYLDGAVNVSQDGSTVPAATLPADGFFEQTDVVGSDFDSWKGNWTFGQ